jgi:hypothetical protein
LEEKNQLREVIKELFRERDCVTIVRPVADEAELRNIQNVAGSTVPRRVIFLNKQPDRT